MIRRLTLKKTQGNFAIQPTRKHSARLAVVTLLVLLIAQMTILQYSPNMEAKAAPTEVDVTIYPSNIIGSNNLSLGAHIEQPIVEIANPSFPSYVQNADLKVIRFMADRYGARACTYWNESKKVGTWDWTEVDKSISKIFAVGAEPLITLGYVVSGGSLKELPTGMAINTLTGLPNPDSWAAYCREWVKHFRIASKPVRIYEVMNEPWLYFLWNNYTRMGYFKTVFNAAAAAMRTENPNIQISFDGTDRKPVLDYWLANGGADLDFISFHKYDAGTIGYRTDAEMLNRAENFLIKTDSSYYGISDARKKYYNARGEWIPVRCTESNFNSAWATGTDPKIQQMIGAVWTALELRAGLIEGLDLNLYQCLSGSASWSLKNNPSGGRGFGLINTDDNKPWYPYFVHKFISCNMNQGDELLQSASGSEEIRTLAWINKDKINVLVINKVDQPRAINLLGLTGTINYSKIDNTISWLTPALQTGTIDSSESIIVNGYAVALLEAQNSTPPDQYTLTVTSAGSGSVTKSPNQATYTYGTVVTLTATPGIGYDFSGWSGDLNGNTNPATITINGNKTVTATFTVSSSVLPFNDGFESGSFSAWALPSLTAGETRSVVSTMMHDGSYAGLFTSNGNGGVETAYVHKIVSPLSELYARAYIRVSASGVAENGDRFYPIIFKAGGTSVAFAGWQRTGGVAKWNLLIRHGTGWANVFSSATPALDKWYCVELHWKKDAAAGLGELWVDGVNVCAASAKNTAYYGEVTQVNVGLPEIINCASVQAYVDCAVISTAYIGSESGSARATVHLESAQDMGATLNLGSVTLDAASYVLPNNVSKALQSFSVAYVTAGDYLFDHWETSGGISVASALSQTTTVTITGAGTLRAVYKVAVSKIFEDGFESGTFNAWSGQQGTISAAKTVPPGAHQGTYYCTGSITTSGGASRIVEKLESTYSSLYVRMYVRMEDLFTGGKQGLGPRFSNADNSAAIGFVLVDCTNNKWGYQVLNTGLTSYFEASSSMTIQADKWYCVEFYMSIGQTGNCTLWVDGVQKLTGTYDNDAQGNIGYVSASSYCFTTQAASRTWYGDDFASATTYIGT